MQASINFIGKHFGEVFPFAKAYQEYILVHIEYSQSTEYALFGGEILKFGYRMSYLNPFFGNSHH
jgi:hypothetical protein